MTVELSGRLTEAIRQHARVAHPEEACGILVGRLDVGRVRVRHALPCVNRAPAEERTRRFEIDPRAVLNLQRALRETSQAIVGFYHSHPGSPPAPSRTDLQYLRLWPETVWVIAGVEDGCEGRLRAWWLDARGVAAEEMVAEGPRAVGGGRRGRARVGMPSRGPVAADAGPGADVGSAWSPGKDLSFHDRVKMGSLRELPIASPHHAPAGGCPE